MNYAENQTASIEWSKYRPDATRTAFSTIRETMVLRIVADETEKTVSDSYQNGQTKEGETDATFQTDLSSFSGRTESPGS